MGLRYCSVLEVGEGKVMSKRQKLVAELWEDIDLILDEVMVVQDIERLRALENEMMVVHFLIRSLKVK